MQLRPNDSQWESPNFLVMEVMIHSKVIKKMSKCLCFDLLTDGNVSPTFDVEDLISWTLCKRELHGTRHEAPSFPNIEEEIEDVLDNDFFSSSLSSVKVDQALRTHGSPLNILRS